MLIIIELYVPHLMHYGMRSVTHDRSSSTRKGFGLAMATDVEYLAHWNRMGDTSDT